MTRESLTSKSVVFKKNIWNIAYITKSGKLCSLPRIKSRQQKKTYKKKTKKTPTPTAQCLSSIKKVGFKWPSPWITRMYGGKSLCPVEVVMTYGRPEMVPFHPCHMVQWKMGVSPIAGFTFEILPFSAESWLWKKKSSCCFLGWEIFLLSRGLHEDFKTSR